MAKNYYNLLGIKKNAPKEEIKKAFRRLAHEHHPDRGGDESKFKEINEAYQTLSNDNKRAEYDMYGETRGGASGGSTGQGFGGFDFSGFRDFSQGGSTSGWNVDLNDIFSDIFGGSRRQEERGSDVSIDIQISFGDSIFGTHRNVVLTKSSNCKSCAGSGAKGGSSLETCSKCNGRGSIKEARRTVFGTFTAEAVCKDCAGAGKQPKEKCPECKGMGIHRQSDQISVDIPAGIENGEMIRMSGLGEGLRGGTSGDLYIKVHVEPHPVFKRAGIDLVMEMPIKLTTALVGGSYTIDTLDGKETIKIPPGTNEGALFRIKDRGVPTDRGRGSLLVSVRIQMPNKLSHRATELLEELKKEGL
ncbi:MAG TPA: molecular chaperone DnaJ [Candidatus Paceibacterota bacterium]